MIAIVSPTFLNSNINLSFMMESYVGIITNLTVIVVFLNHKKLRRKIPNIFIINQVSVLEVDTFTHRELQTLFRQECIPVGRVPSAGVTVCRGGSALGRSA